MAGAVPGRRDGDSGRITGAVLERIRVENQLSLTTRVRGLFDDMHLVWAGLGASVATLFCVFASAGVLQAASQERPDSLAGIISTIVAADTSDPMRLAPTVTENRALLDTTEAMQSTGGDAELMLSALVTREGRIQNLEVLEEQARALHVKPEVMLAMVEAASRARFERQSGYAARRDQRGVARDHDDGQGPAGLRPVSGESAALVDRNDWAAAAAQGDARPPSNPRPPETTASPPRRLSAA